MVFSKCTQKNVLNLGKITKKFPSPNLSHSRGEGRLNLKNCDFKHGFQQIYVDKCAQSRKRGEKIFVPQFWPQQGRGVDEVDNICIFIHFFIMYGNKLK